MSERYHNGSCDLLTVPCYNMMKQILGSKTVTVCHLPSALQEIKTELIFSDNASRFISISHSLSLYFSLESDPSVFGCWHERVRMINTHKISSSDSTSFSLGFKSPISMGGILLSLERTALEGEQ